MNLPLLSIRRPILILMVNLFIMLLGIISIDRLGVDKFPKIEVPVISVTTILTGGSPSVIDRDVTQVIESAINSVSDIDFISSTSVPSASIVLVAFDLAKDINVAFNEIQSKLIRVFKDLPKDVELPIIEKLEVGAEPVVWITLQGNRTLQELNVYAADVVKKRLQNINGVGDVVLGGERKRTIRINLDPQKMAAFSLTPQEVADAFQREHLALPGGFITTGKAERLVDLDLEFHTVNDLRELIVAYRNGAPVQIKQIAEVEDGLSDRRALAQYNGVGAVALGVIKTAGANTVAIVKEVKARLKNEIIPELPSGMKIGIAVDDSAIILDIIHSLVEHLFLGTLLAALVVLLFLKNFRSTLIIATAIPVSLLGAIGSMYLAGFTFNVLTLLALLLLIGVVVDDSIVVLENIYRKIKEGGGDRESLTVKATYQVMFAVLASTLTIVSIFVPVIFLGGILGRFFQSFAIVVTVGVLISLFVSLSLVPMLCSRYLSVVESHGTLYQKLENYFLHLERIYMAALDWGLRHRWKLLGITFLMLLGSAVIFNQLGKQFLPKIDEGRFLVNFKTPLGSSLDYTEDRLNHIEKILLSRPDVASIFSTVGTGALGQVTRGVIYVRLTDRNDRKLKQYEIVHQLVQDMSQVPGIKAYPSNPAVVGGSRGEPLQFVLEGPDLNGVKKYGEQLAVLLSKNKALGDLDTDREFDQPQYRLSVDRVRAQGMGLNTRSVVEALSIFNSGLNVAKFNDKNSSGDHHDIRLKVNEGEIIQPGDLARVFLHNREGDIIRLDNIAALSLTLNPAAISRSDLLYATNFFSSPSIPMDAAIKAVNEAAKKILPLGYHIELRGEVSEFEKTQKYLSFTFILAVVLVYMVLASQFNSFIQPVALMLALPLAVIGGLVALWAFGFTLNIYSMIGIVLLMGLVAKNSILLIDLTNQFRAQGLGIDEALRQACPERMRPVLMTSLTIILALFPAALGYGAGSDTNGPLAVAIIGGMVSSTLLTLIVIPAVYSLIEHRLQKP